VTRYIEHNLSPDADKFKARNDRHLELAKQAADDKLLFQEAERPRVRRMRYLGCVPFLSLALSLSEHGRLADARRPPRAAPLTRPRPTALRSGRRPTSRASSSRPRRTTLPRKALAVCLDGRGRARRAPGRATGEIGLSLVSRFRAPESREQQEGLHCDVRERQRKKGERAHLSIGRIAPSSFSSRSLSRLTSAWYAVSSASFLRAGVRWSASRKRREGQRAKRRTHALGFLLEDESAASAAGSGRLPRFFLRARVECQLVRARAG